MNAFPNFLTEIDGQTVHYVHVRSPESGATPLLLAHTYPGSFSEFLDMIGPLTDPVSHGGRPEDAFDVVIPSMPGFGFSTPLIGDGWTMARVAHTYDALMRRLGYESYGAHGSDGGAMIPVSWRSWIRLASWARTSSSCFPFRPVIRVSSSDSVPRSTPLWSFWDGSSP